MKTFLCAANLSLMTMSAWAHHSFASYDRDKNVTVAGILKEFQWTNPHCWIIVLVPDVAGGAIEYRVEAPPPINLIRGGWTQDTLQPGDHVTVEFHPRKDAPAGGTVRILTLPTGNHMGSTGPPPTAALAGSPQDRLDR